MLKIVVTLGLVLLCLKPSLAESDPAPAPEMSKLIEKVNEERVKLNKKFFIKLTELKFNTEEENKLKKNIRCHTHGALLDSYAATEGTKLAYSSTRKRSAWTHDSLKDQIINDFEAAIAQLNGNTCKKADECGLAQVLLPRETTEISLWTKQCTDAADDFMLVYVVKPETAVGQEMNKDGSKCIDGYVEKPFPPAQTITKLCENPSSTGGESTSTTTLTTSTNEITTQKNGVTTQKDGVTTQKDGVTTQKTEVSSPAGAASLVTCPLLVLTAFLSAGARLRG